MATRLLNGRPRFSDHLGSKTPEPIDIKLERGDYVGDIIRHANFGISIPNGAVVHMREFVIIRVYFYSPLLFYLLRTCRQWRSLTRGKKIHNIFGM